MYLFWSLVLFVCVQNKRTHSHDGIRLVKSATIVGNKVFEGLKAVKYLLKDSKPIEGDMKFMSDVINEFKKSGGNAHAYRDFWAIKPMNIRRSGPSGSSITFGRVGDRVVILNEKGVSDMPTIEIIKDNVGSLSPDIDFIYYQ